MPIQVDTDALTRKLADLEQKVQKRVVVRSLRAAANVLVPALEAAAPVELKWPGGTALLPDSLAPAFSARIRNGPNGYPQASILPRKGTTHVARWIEYGHRLVRGGRSGLNKKGQLVGRGRQVRARGVVRAGEVDADPFIAATFAAEADAAINAFRTTFSSELQKRGG